MMSGDRFFHWFNLVVAVAFFGRAASSQEPEVLSKPERERLEQDAVRLATQASTITLQGDRSPEEMTAAFRAQTGQRVLFPAADDRPIRVDWKNTPFWKAVLDVETQISLCARGDRDQRAISFLLCHRAPVSTAVTGPCRVAILRTTVRENLVEPDKALLQVRWQVRAEPRLRPLYLIAADRDFRIDRQGKTWLPLSPDSSREIPCDRWVGCEADTAFVIPKGFSLDDAMLGAKGVLKVAALPLELVFDDLNRPQPCRRGEVSGELSNVVFDSLGRAMSFDLTVAYDHGGPEFESHRMWIYQNAAWLKRRSTGVELKPDHVDLRQIAATGATLTYTFKNLAAAPADYAFIYEAPSLIVDVPLAIDRVPLAPRAIK